jgi:hypothetical protein
MMHELGIAVIDNVIEVKLRPPPAQPERIVDKPIGQAVGIVPKVARSGQRECKMAAHSRA